MSNNITPSICDEGSMYMPPIGECDECDRLATEFEQAKEDAIQAATDSQGYAEQSEAAKQGAEAAQEGAEQAESDSEHLRDSMLDILAEAEYILEQIHVALTGRLSQVFTTEANQSSFTFAPPGYIYEEGDYYEVYVNGLKLTPLEYTVSANVVNLVTPISLAGQTVEILAYVSVPGESE